MSELILSKETLLKSGLPEETITVDGLGTVRVRSLSRAEFLRIRQADGEGWEIGIVACGLVEPALSEEEVRDWHGRVAPRIFDDLAAEILRVSGLRKATADPAVEDATHNFPENEGS